MERTTKNKIIKNKTSKNLRSAKSVKRIRKPVKINNNKKKKNRPSKMFSNSVKTINFINGVATGREQYLDVVKPGSTSDYVLIPNTKFNPGLMACTRLKNIAKDYRKYKLLSFNIVYEPSVPEDYDGTIVIAPNYDPDQDDSEISQVELNDMVDVVTGRLNKKLICRCKGGSSKKDVLLVRHFAEEKLVDYDFLTFNISYESSETTTGLLGRIFLEYKLKFFEPKVSILSNENPIITYAETVPFYNVPTNLTMENKRLNDKYDEVYHSSSEAAITAQRCELRNIRPCLGEDNSYLLIDHNQEAWNEYNVTNLQAHGLFYTSGMTILSEDYQQSESSTAVPRLLSMYHRAKAVVSETIDLVSDVYLAVESAVCSLAASSVGKAVVKIAKVSLSVFAGLILIDIKHSIEQLQYGIKNQKDVELTYLNIGNLMEHKGWNKKALTEFRQSYELMLELISKATKLGLRIGSTVKMDVKEGRDLTVSTGSKMSDDWIQEKVISHLSNPKEEELKIDPW